MVGAMNAVTQAVQGKFNVLRPLLDERTRRLWAAAEARAIGRGGIARVAEATGLSRGTVRAGVRELDSATPPEARAGGRAGLGCALRGADARRWWIAIRAS